MPVYPAYHAAGHPAGWDRPVSDRRPGSVPAGSVPDAGALGIVLSPLVQAVAFLNSTKSMEFAVRDTRHLLDLEELPEASEPARLRQRYHFAGCVFLV